MSDFKMEIKWLDPKELTPYVNNSKKHSDEQIDKLAGSIAAFGFDQPVVVDRERVIVKGHGRREAALRLGLKSIPVVFADHLDENQIRAARIADNKLSSLEYDVEKLSFDIGTLERSGFDLNLTGIEFDEIKGLLSGELGGEKVGAIEPVEGEDDVPEDVITRTKLGDIYQLGDHRLMCGDSTSPEAVATLMNGEKADMVFTDPPYGINLETDYKGSLGDNGFRNAKTYKKVHGDNQDFNFSDFYSLVQDIPEQFWWGADYYCQHLPKGGSWFVWNKRTTEGLEKMYGNHFELCWSKKKHQREIASVAWAGAFGHNKKDDGPTKVHPTMKAIKLIEWFFGRFEGQKVIDLFGGSGSTLIACEKTSRKCFMMELDPHYCDVIVARWEQFTGKTAELLTPHEPS